MQHTHQLAYAGSLHGSVFTFTHDHERGDEAHAHEVDPSGNTVLSTTFTTDERKEAAH